MDQDSNVSCEASQVDISAKIGALFEQSIQFADASENPMTPPVGARYAMQIRNRETSQLLLSLDSQGGSPAITIDNQGFIQVSAMIPENITPQCAVYDFVEVNEGKTRVLFEGNFYFRRQVTNLS